MFGRSLILASIAAGPLWAADFQLQAPVLVAQVYPQGATVTRALSVDLPSGTHRLLLPVPPSMDFASPPRIAGIGELAVGGIEVLPKHLVDAESVYTDAQRAAFDAMRAAETALWDAEDRAAGLDAAVLAAQVRIDFLSSVQATGESGFKASELREIGAMLEEEIVIAHAAMQSAKEAARLGRDAVEKAQKVLAQAEQDLKRLAPPNAPVDMLSITVTAAEPVFANLTLTHLVYAASWRPSYAMNLDRENGIVEVERRITVAQSTGEIWRDVALSLSTADPFSQISPSQVEPNRAIIVDEKSRLGTTSIRPQAGLPNARSEMMLEVSEEPLIIEDAAKLLEGETIRYEYPRPISIAPSDGLLSLSLDKKLLEAEVVNRAVPRFDQTAFTVAKLSNSLDEPLLPGPVELSKDGDYVGLSDLPMIPAGTVEEISFGAVEGLRLEFKFLDNNTGDRGILTSSNTRDQEMEFSVENLTSETTSVEAVFALPFSEQEDLELGVSARPAADVTAVNGDRGVGQWNLELAPDAKSTVRIRVGLTWPEGFELMWRP